MKEDISINYWALLFGNNNTLEDEIEAYFLLHKIQLNAAELEYFSEQAQSFFKRGRLCEWLDEAPKIYKVLYHGKRDYIPHPRSIRTGNKIGRPAVYTEEERKEKARYNGLRQKYKKKGLFYSIEEIKEMQEAGIIKRNGTRRKK